MDIDFAEQFKEAIAESGLCPPNAVVPDGAIHRFSSNGKPDDDAGWYVLFADGSPAGAFGDWRSGVNKRWRPRGAQYKAGSSRQDEHARMAAISEARRQETARRHGEARTRASNLWESASPAEDSHPYLAKKRVKSYGLKEKGGQLLVPLCDGGKVHSLQTIDSAGRKHFLLGGRKRGCYFQIGGADESAVEQLFVVEGYATGASVYEATGKAVFAAFDAGNLVAVAEALRARYPTADIVICADDDLRTVGNPGLTAANAAAGHIGGRVAVPKFADPRPDGLSDFNDMACVHGIDAVRRHLAAVLAERVVCPIRSDVPLQMRGSRIGWEQPREIGASLHSVVAFDAYALLPDVLREWLLDEADRMPCPPDFLAAATIVALGAVIGARCAIKPKSQDDWTIVPNLWGGIVAPPSAKKSPAISAALKPLDFLVGKAKEHFKQALQGFESHNLVFTARHDALQKRIKTMAAAGDKGRDNIPVLMDELEALRGTEPTKPIQRRYKTNDTTIEKLGELLVDNPGGILVIRDELVGLLASWDREGREGERAFFLEAWNGTAGFDTDRIGRGSISIPNLCASIFGGIQPDKLTGYLDQAANALANDGMLQRFSVLVYPDPMEWEWRDRLPDQVARDRVFGVFELLAEFDPEEWGAESKGSFAKFPSFRFDSEAQRLFVEWSARLHQIQLKSEDHPLIAQHLVKYNKLFPAIALILHLVDCAATGRRGPISAEAAGKAWAWCTYLESHARRCYGLLVDDGLRAAQALAEKIRKGKVQEGFTARDVRRQQWRGLTQDEMIRAALDWLEDEGWIKSEETGGSGPGSGRRTSRYYINPLIRAGLGKLSSGS